MQLAAWLTENGHSIGWRYFGAYNAYEPCDCLITIGWNNLINTIHEDHTHLKKPTIAFSDGFVHRGWKPGAHFAVTRNGLHAYGDVIRMMPGDRWTKLNIQFMPWRESKKDDPILIAHQHVSAYDGQDRQAFFHSIIAELQQRTNRQLILRPHPRDKTLSGLPGGCLISRRPLIEDLSAAHAVVTYDSNIAVEALIYGIPVFTFRRTMADPLACHDIAQIENPEKPDRQQWAHDLAYCQWNVQEIRNGLPWIHLIGALLANRPSGLADVVPVPARENGNYCHDASILNDELTNWNGKDGQTQSDIAKELHNPKVMDQLVSMRVAIQALTNDQIVTRLLDYGIVARASDERESLIGRLLHVSF
jgi:hypothetical protein